MHVADFFRPIHVPAVKQFRYCEVRHAVGGGSPMPMLDPRRRPYHIAGLDLLLLATLLLNPASACSHDQNLAERMDMPRRTRARLERYGADRDP